MGFGVGESVPVRCPECLRTQPYAAPVFPCACGTPVVPPVIPGATGEPVTHRNWTDEWVAVRCVSCGREDEWPHPELGCTCGTVLRVPVREPGFLDAGPLPGIPGPARTLPRQSTGRNSGCRPDGQAPDAKPGPLGSDGRSAAGSRPDGTDTAPRDRRGAGDPPGAPAGEMTDDTAPASAPRAAGADGPDPGPGAWTGDDPGGDRPEDDRHDGPVGGLHDGPQDGLHGGREDGVRDGAEDGLHGGPEDALRDGPENGLHDGPEDALRDGAEDGLHDVASRGRGAGRSRAFTDRYPAHIPLPPTAPHPAAPRPSFRPVTIRTARDAVAASAGYLRWLGFRDVVQPEERSASGVDLRAPGLVAQVDPSTRPAALRAVECLWLNGLSSSSVSVFFSLAGYTSDARSRADELGIPLFVLDLTGTPQPVNTPADELITTGA